MPAELSSINSLICLRGDILNYISRNAESKEMINFILTSEYLCEVVYLTMQVPLLRMRQCQPK